MYGQSLEKWQELSNLLTNTQLDDRGDKVK